MIATIQPSVITGTITAPASKSSMQRACALALLVGGETTLINPGKSNDCIAALDIIQKLGANLFKQEAESLLIVDSKTPPPAGGGGGLHNITI